MLLPLPSEDDRYRELLRRVDSLETALRAAFTTISGGAGLRIVDGGSLALKAPDGTLVFYIGPVAPNQTDGSPQPGWLVTRADGTVVLMLRDQFPGDDGAQLNQALNWYDREGNVVLADDTNSGRGLARPFLTGGFYKARFNDWTVATTSGAFETLWQQQITKQQPRLIVGYRAATDASGVTGETRVMVNGVQWGATQAEEFVANYRNLGPLPVAGANGSSLLVEIQGRRTSASGSVRVEAAFWQGFQS